MTSTNETLSASRTKLADDFKVLSKDVQELVKATSSVITDKAAEARLKVEDSLKIAQKKLAEVQVTLNEKRTEAVRVTDGYVKSNPWNAVGIAAGIGLIIGVSLTLGSATRRR